MAKIKRIIAVALITSMALSVLMSSILVSSTESPIETSMESSTLRERQRITIVDGGFAVDGGTRPIWINGVNTPWNYWNDFSGNNFDYDWWDNHFRILSENGVNSSRVWISCNNNQGRSNQFGHVPIVTIAEKGMVSGVSDRHWEHLDDFFAIAERHGIYIMATITSFDHFRFNEWSNAVPERWRNMVQSTSAIESFVEHYTIPFVERYGDNPFLWSIDIINEPDWVHEDPACGQLAWADISHFIAPNKIARLISFSIL